MPLVRTSSIKRTGYRVLNFKFFSSQNRLGTGPDGLRIYLAFCIQDNDSVEDETNHDDKSEMNYVKSLKLFVCSMLADSSMRKEVCPTFCASLIKKVLNNFVLDGFLSTPTPNSSCCA
ncbi:uncharacterized protein LOC131331429 isoform X2 [Rhododendron vialii]|uniref:uncharacterized protein LOC131331429 isoform X2 n=1 Tax=Rhododendron vialii TaxID=182163 RepID=UPI00265E91C4|nr:uncharacterized protein LOC131331429 isoform X2 [Rhododendron vialii]